MTIFPHPVSREPYRYAITSPDGNRFSITVKGRTWWALESLRLSGDRGCTPIDNPAPRWSAYIHDLRKLGVEIETRHEPHGGAFAGTHGRYILRSKVARADEHYAEVGQ